MNISKIIENYFQTDCFYTYADTAFTHQGDEDYLYKQVTEAKKAGCRGVKFQMLLNIDSAYRKDSNNFAQLQQWIFPQSVWGKIISKTRELGLEVIILPIDCDSVKFCQEYRRKLSAIEIHPININDQRILDLVMQIPRIPVLIGNGGSTRKETDYVLKFFRNRAKALIFGYQSFPTDYMKLSLSRIREWMEYFNVPVGYADHTAPDDPYHIRLPEYAYLLGSRLFEKHILPERNQNRIDGQSACTGAEIKLAIHRLENLKQILGKKDSKRSRDEIIYHDRMKQLIWSKNMLKNEIIAHESICFKVCPEKSDYLQREYSQLIGKKTKRPCKRDTVIKKKDC